VLTKDKVTQCVVSRFKTIVWSAVFRPWHRPAVVFATHLLPGWQYVVWSHPDIHLFSLFSSLRGRQPLNCLALTSIISGRSSFYCCYGNHAAGSKL